MRRQFNEILQGYKRFQVRHASGDASLMERLGREGQQPCIMVVSCSDSRADPAVILQCNPGDLFVVRNVANIVPPYEKNETYHSSISAALEFGVCFLNVTHLILLGHSQCAGIRTRFNIAERPPNEFITNWVSVLQKEKRQTSMDDYARAALHESYANCLTFPWIAEKVGQKTLEIHRWFFDIQKGEISVYSDREKGYSPLVI